MQRRELLRRTGVGVAGLATLAGGPAGRVVARTGGTVEWRFETGGPILGSPTVVDGVVYVGSRDGTLYALDATAGGEVRWTYAAGDAIHGAPNVVGGTVYVGSFDGRLHAVDAATGEADWTFGTVGAVAGSPTATRDAVLVGDDAGTVYAVERATGQRRWRYGTAGAIRSSPTAAVESVYPTKDYPDTVVVGARWDSLYAFDPEFAESQVRWEFSTIGRMDSSPTVVDGTVYVGQGNRNGGGALFAVDAETGQEVWNVRADAAFDSSPTVADGRVYVGNDDGSLYAFGAGSGQRDWRFEPGRPVVSSPTVVGGTVFVGDGTERTNGAALHAVDARTGDAIWTFEAGAFFTSPTVVDGTVYVGNGDGSLYAVAAGVDGRSDGSRVRLGTLGHHEVWANRYATAGEGTPDSTARTDTPSTGTNDGGSAADGAGTNGGDGGGDAENRVDGGTALVDPDAVPWAAVGGGLAVGVGAGLAKWFGGSVGSTVSGLLSGGGGSTGAASAGSTGGGQGRPARTDRTESRGEDAEGPEADPPGIVARVDPLSATAWCVTPVLQQVEEWGGGAVSVSYEPAPVRELDPGEMRERWVALDERFRLPVDPTFWDRDPPESTELVTRAFAAAVEQDRGRDYVRAQWRRAVVAGEPISDRATLVGIAEAVGLDVGRFEADLGTVDLPDGDPPAALPAVRLSLLDTPVSLTGELAFRELDERIPFLEFDGGRARSLRAFVRDYRRVTPTEVMRVYDLGSRAAAVERLRELEGATVETVGDEQFWQLRGP